MAKQHQIIWSMHMLKTKNKENEQMNNSCAQCAELKRKARNTFPKIRHYIFPAHHEAANHEAASQYYARTFLEK